MTDVLPPLAVAVVAVGSDYQCVVVVRSDQCTAKRGVCTQYSWQACALEETRIHLTQSINLLELNQAGRSSKGGVSIILTTSHCSYQQCWVYVCMMQDFSFRPPYKKTKEISGAVCALQSATSLQPASHTAFTQHHVRRCLSLSFVYLDLNYCPPPE